MLRPLLCLVSFMATLTGMTTVHAQPLQPPPTGAQPRSVQEEVPPARALLHLGGGGGFLTRESSSTGYQQLDRVGYNAPDTSWHLNAGAQFVATDWLRVGGELSYEFAGDTTELIVRGVGTTRATRFHMGIIDLTPYIQAGRLQLGLRFAGGFGFSRWVHDSRGSGSGVYRASAAIDVFIPMSRRSSKGLNVRFGYQLRRTLPTGPIDLVFDHSSIFFNVAFMFGASS